MFFGLGALEGQTAANEKRHARRTDNLKMFNEFKRLNPEATLAELSDLKASMSDNSNFGFYNGGVPTDAVLGAIATANDERVKQRKQQEFFANQENLGKMRSTIEGLYNDAILNAETPEDAKTAVEGQLTEGMRGNEDIMSMFNSYDIDSVFKEQKSKQKIAKLAHDVEVADALMDRSPEEIAAALPDLGYEGEAEVKRMTALAKKRRDAFQRNVDKEEAQNSKTKAEIKNLDAGTQFKTTQTAKIKKETGLLAREFDLKEEQIDNLRALNDKKMKLQEELQSHTIGLQNQRLEFDVTKFSSEEQAVLRRIALAEAQHREVKRANVNAEDIAEKRQALAELTQKHSNLISRRNAAVSERGATVSETRAAKEREVSDARIDQIKSAIKDTEDRMKLAIKADGRADSLDERQYVELTERLEQAHFARDMETKKFEASERIIKQKQRTEFRTAIESSPAVADLIARGDNTSVRQYIADQYLTTTGEVMPDAELDKQVEVAMLKDRTLAAEYMKSKGVAGKTVALQGIDETMKFVSTSIKSIADSTFEHSYEIDNEAERAQAVEAANQLANRYVISSPGSIYTMVMEAREKLGEDAQATAITDYVVQQNGLKNVHHEKTRIQASGSDLSSNASKHHDNHIKATNSYKTRIASIYEGLQNGSLAPEIAKLMVRSLGEALAEGANEVKHVQQNPKAYFAISNEDYSTMATEYEEISAGLGNVMNAIAKRDDANKGVMDLYGADNEDAHVSHAQSVNREDEVKAYNEGYGKKVRTGKIGLAFKYDALQKQARDRGFENTQNYEAYLNSIGIYPQ